MKLVAVTLTLLLVASVAFGFPPPGTDLSSPVHLWWECHKQPVNNTMSCCSEADGHSLSDSEWRVTNAGYEVQVENHWWPVPDNTILMGDTCGPDPNEAQASEAKVWYQTFRGISNQIETLNVLCFEPGEMY